MSAKTTMTASVWMDFLAILVSFATFRATS